MDSRLLDDDAGSVGFARDNRKGRIGVVIKMGFSMAVGGVVVMAFTSQLPYRHKAVPSVQMMASSMCGESSACLQNGISDPTCCAHMQDSSCLPGFTHFNGASCSYFTKKVYTCCVAEDKAFEEVTALHAEVEQLEAEFRNTSKTFDQKFEDLKKMPGPVGPRGPKGEVGSKGETGDRGVKGEKGDRGANGATGQFCSGAFCLAWPMQNCAAGRDIDDVATCQAAYTALSSQFKFPQKRGLQEGDWHEVPMHCSVQFEGGYVDENQDCTPHLQTSGSSDNSRMPEFRAMCRV